MTVALPKGEYYELRFLQAQCDGIDGEELQAVARLRESFKAKRRQAQQRTAQKMDELAGRYGFDAQREFRWRDDACALELID